MSDANDALQNETGEIRSAHRFDVAVLRWALQPAARGFVAARSEFGVAHTRSESTA